MKEWQAIALAVFGVTAGRILQMGQKIDRGEPVTWRDLLVLCSLLPAFGALIGSAGSYYKVDWPVIIGTSVVAGWLGFAFMRLVVAGWKKVAPELMPPFLQRLFQPPAGPNDKPGE